MSKKALPLEALASLRQRFDQYKPRSRERKELLKSTAQLYDVSVETLYRALRTGYRLKAVRRSDSGQPRKISKVELNQYCEVIAALKVRTRNKKGRHLSTVRAIELLEQYGLETPQGHLQAPPGMLNKYLVNRYLKAFGYDKARLGRQPTVVHFQAEHSNDCWQFDLSPSDLKHVEQPLWIEPGRGSPTLMLFSVVDDRSGVCYQEYRCVYGEDVESALRFLYNAMTPKNIEGFPFQGIPKMLYSDYVPRNIITVMCPN